MIYPLTIQQIITRLEDLLTKLSRVKDHQQKEAVIFYELDKTCNSLNYLESAFEELKKFETNLSKPLRTREDNVGDILLDLDSKDSVKEMIEHNLDALKSNITKVKAQIPLQSPASFISEGGYLKTRTSGQYASKY
ncbi:hypothetical protein V6N13_145292 [Hibiscus sabdariffa]|uniref:Uncharacterized protein n=2 Tax=Hibiscus sabdariffa TaxID=183260 RepID=A0ABR2APB9_9ROSI